LANENDTVVVCGEYTGELIYETCSNEMRIEILTGQLDENDFDGVAVYYESILKVF
jgi:hypothetical protein